MPTAVLNAVWKVDTKSLEAGLARAKNKMQSAGSSITGVGKTVTKVAAVSVGAIGAIALKANSEIAGAGRTIRSTTGATGAELEGLKKSFSNVFTSVPVDAATAAQAISTLHQRTGMTGKGLEDLATSELTLARITKEDLGGLMENTTRLFGDWSIATEDQAEALDKVYRASQQTGVPVTKLSEMMVKYGAPMRQFGFSFEESAALMGKFEKEGVNTELVMGSLRIALGKLATANAGTREAQIAATAAQEAHSEAVKKFGPNSLEAQQAAINLEKAEKDLSTAVSGSDLPTALRDQMNAIKNAKSNSEATGLAFELFGKRAGADMAAAIREGRFSIDDLVKQISGGGDSIKKAGDDTKTFSQQMQEVKNGIMVALAPLGKAIMSIIKQQLPAWKAFAAKVGELMQKFSELSPKWQKVIIAAGVFFALLGPALVVVGSLVSAIGTIVGTFKMLQIALKISTAVQWLWNAALSANPIGIIILAIAAFVAAIVILWKKNEAFREFIIGAWTAIKDWLVGAWNWIKTAAETIWTAISGAFSAAWEAIKRAAITIWEGIKTALKFAALAIVAVTIGPIVLLVMAIRAHWEQIKASTAAIWNGIKTTLSAVWGAISGAVKTAFSNLAYNITHPFEFAKNVLKGIVNGIIRLINGMIDALNSLKINVPDWVPKIGGKKFGLNIGKIPYLAEGGYVSKPTLAMIGEAGPEYVVPERKLLAMISGGAALAGAGNTNVTVYADSFADERRVAGTVRTEADRLARQSVVRKRVGG